MSLSLFLLLCSLLSAQEPNLSEANPREFLKDTQEFLSKIQTQKVTMRDLVDHFLRLYANSSLDRCIEFEQKIHLNQKLTQEEQMDIKLKEIIEEFLAEISINVEFEKQLILNIVRDNSLFHFIEHKMMTEEETNSHREKIKRTIEEDFKSGMIDDIEREINEMDEDL